MESVEEKNYYTAKEAQETLGITYSALRNHVRAGRIQSATPPGKRQAVYLKEDVDQLLQSREEKNYYTAKEAQETLGMTYSALRNQVDAGNITSPIPPGRLQAVYLKEDVDRLKAEMDAWLASKRQAELSPAKFVKATIEDMPEAVALAGDVFGGLNTISVETRYAVKSGDEVIGYALIVARNPKRMKRVLRELEKLTIYDDDQEVP